MPRRSDAGPAAPAGVQEPDPAGTDFPTVRIDRLAAGGDGVGRMPDGRVVFVPRTAPGDRVRLGRVRTHARYARARVAQLLEPGPGRTEPRCRHYLAQDCGGCQWQHLTPETQLAARRDLVREALQRIGRLDVEVAPVVPADSPWSYRSRITLALGPGRRFAGFHPLDSADRVFPLERCEIAAPALVELWERCRPHLALLPRDAERMVLQLDRTGARHLLVRAAGDRAWTGATALADRLGDADLAIWWQPRGGAPRIVAGRRDGGPVGVFEQVVPGMGHRIREWALARLGSLAGVHAWDLYAGIGETTLELAARGATVESVELDPRAVALAQAAWEHAPPHGAGAVRRHVGPAEELVGRLEDPAVVVANPPRAGMDQRVTEALAARLPGRIAYISCDPATLARDLGRLCGPAREGGYRVTAVQPFDLFPQTAHVETVALLERAG